MNNGNLEFKKARRKAEHEGHECFELNKECEQAGNNKKSTR